MFVGGGKRVGEGVWTIVGEASSPAGAAAVTPSSGVGLHAAANASEIRRMLVPRIAHHLFAISDLQNPLGAWMPHP